jgi:hypothetical protein
MCIKNQASEVPNQWRCTCTAGIIIWSTWFLLHKVYIPPPWWSEKGTLFTAVHKCWQIFYIRVTVHRDKFPYNKPTRCTNLSDLFWNETLLVSDRSSVHHQELFTVHSAVVYVIRARRNCPQHAEFRFQNKFEKLVHLVGFIIRKFVTMHGHMNVKKN